MNILITGASGFVGAHLAKTFIEQNNQVISIQHDEKRITTSKLLDIHKDITWCHGDIIHKNLINRIIADYDIDAVIHAAAMPIERGGWIMSTPYIETNIGGTFNVIECVKEAFLNGYPIPLIHISSDKAYGDLGNTIATEHDRFNPNSVYSCSKSCSDLLVQTYIKVFDINAVVIRPCNIYGEGDTNPRILPNTIKSCIHRINPVIYRNLTNAREYIYVQDICTAIEKIIKKNKITKGETFNIGSGVIKTQEDCVIEVLKHFETLVGEYENVPEYVKSEIPYQAIDSVKIHDMIGWQPKVSFEDGIKRTIQWYLEK